MDYFINTSVMGEGGVGAPGHVVDGVFTDDVQVGMAVRMILRLRMHAKRACPSDCIDAH